MFKYSALALVVVGLFVSSCNNEEEPTKRTLPSKPKKLSVTSPGLAKWGDTVFLEIPDSVEQATVFIKGNQVPSEITLGRVRLLTTDIGMGEHTISVQAGEISGRTLLNVFSDITPEQKTIIAVEKFPHSAQNFTQGLEFDGGKLYEGTGSGNAMESKLMVYNTPGGSIIRETSLESQYFGEGITILGDEVYQLTWKNGECLVYDKETLELKRKMTYSGEGWGLTNDGTHLIMSDGTSALSWRDSKTFEEKKRVTVATDAGPVSDLNELELRGGQVLANVWRSEEVVAIDLESGRVMEVWDCSVLTKQLPLSTSQPYAMDVLNGIAISEDGSIFMTGKNWPTLFKVAIKP